MNKVINKKEGLTNKAIYENLPYCIVIPTYKPHFKYVEKLINSVDKYCKEIINIFIIISTDEYKDAEYLSLLSDKIKINILCFKDILNEMLDININEKHFLTAGGGYKFQSLKKIIAVYYLIEKMNYEYVYVMDSEGIYIKPFSFIEIIENYKKNKRIFYNSKQRHNNEHSNTSKQLLKQTTIPGWFLENYLWIYEDKIVKDFCKYLFYNIKSYEDLLKIPNNIFIEIVYYHYIYINNYNYNYNFIDTYTTMSKYLDIDKYLKNELSNLSLLEDIRVILNKDTIEPICNYFKDYSIEQTKITVNKYNIEFLKKANIKLINSGDFELNFVI
jgi:hypothetical protein